MKNTISRNQLKDIALLYWKWLKECELTCSQHTIRSYEVSVGEYFDYLQKIGLSTKNFTVDHGFAKDTIEAWRKHLLEVKGCSPETSNVRLANLRSFIGYLADSDLKYVHLYMDARNIKPTRTIKKKQYAISDETLKTIMAIPDGESRSGCMDIMLMSFLYGTAVRVGEMRTVQMKDLCLNTPASVHIVGKGNKERIVYIPDKVMENLLLFIKIFHGIHPDPDSFLFYSRTKGKGFPISAAAIDKRLKNIAKTVLEKNPSLDINLHAHAFRRTRATNLSDDGMNPFQISKILGHANLATTMKYVDVSMSKKEIGLMNLESDVERNLEPSWKGKINDLRELFRHKK